MVKAAKGASSNGAAASAVKPLKLTVTVLRDRNILMVWSAKKLPRITDSIRILVKCGEQSKEHIAGPNEPNAWITDPIEPGKEHHFTLEAINLAGSLVGLGQNSVQHRTSRRRRLPRWSREKTFKDGVGKLGHEMGGLGLGEKRRKSPSIWVKLRQHADDLVVVYWTREEALDGKIAYYEVSVGGRGAPRQHCNADVTSFELDETTSRRLTGSNRDNRPHVEVIAFAAAPDDAECETPQFVRVARGGTNKLLLIGPAPMPFPLPSRSEIVGLYGKLAAILQESTTAPITSLLSIDKPSTGRVVLEQDARLMTTGPLNGLHGLVLRASSRPGDVQKSGITGKLNIQDGEFFHIKGAPTGIFLADYTEPTGPDEPHRVLLVCSPYGDNSIMWKQCTERLVELPWDNNPIVPLIGGRPHIPHSDDVVIDILLLPITVAGRT